MTMMTGSPYGLPKYCQRRIASSLFALSGNVRASSWQIPVASASDPLRRTASVIARPSDVLASGVLARLNGLGAPCQCPVFAVGHGNKCLSVALPVQPMQGTPSRKAETRCQIEGQSRGHVTGGGTLFTGPDTGHVDQSVRHEGRPPFERPNLDGVGQFGIDCCPAHRLVIGVPVENPRH